jgi:hypothetical protein
VKAAGPVIACTLPAVVFPEVLPKNYSQSDWISLFMLHEQALAAPMKCN